MKSTQKSNRPAAGIQIAQQLHLSHDAASGAGSLSAQKAKRKKNFHPVGRYSDSDGRKRTGLSHLHLHEKSFRNRRNIEKYTGRQFLASDIPGSPDGIHAAGSPQLPAEHPKIPQIHGERKVAFRKASCLKNNRAMPASHRHDSRKEREFLLLEKQYMLVRIS